MLLSYIVQELDAELNRLSQLRQVVASLETPLVLPASVLQLADADPLSAFEPETETEVKVTEAADPIAEAAPPPVKKPRRAHGSRGHRRVATPPQTPTAFSPPSLPKVVVVSAAQLERERAARATSQHAPQSGESRAPAPPEEVAPEALARSLAAKWLSGTGHSAPLSS